MGRQGWPPPCTHTHRPVGLFCLYFQHRIPALALLSFLAVCPSEAVPVSSCFLWLLCQPELDTEGIDKRVCLSGRNPHPTQGPQGWPQEGFPLHVSSLFSSEDLRQLGWSPAE